jgi:O-methyltransferase
MRQGTGSSLLRRALLRVIRRIAPPFFPPDGYLQKPLETWPPRIGLIHDVRLPRRTRAHPFPRPTGPPNVNILIALINRTLPIEGDVAECGVFRGASLVPMAIQLQQLAPGKHLLGFDSFQGVDDSILFDLSLGAPPEYYKRVGAFDETSRSMVEAKLRRFDCDNAALVPGYFRDSLFTYADRRFCFAHFDLGIYQACKECLEFFYPRMNSGGIILINSYNDPPWPGCNQAVDEFLRGKPEELQLIEMDNYQKFYISKQ